MGYNFGLYLGNNGGNAIVYTKDDNETQQWDVYPVSGTSYYVVYNHNTNNVLARGGGCVANGENLEYCAVVQPQGSPIPASQEWIELRTDPIVFESVGSGGRCLDNPGNDTAGTRVGLYPCDTSDTNQQWLG
jgi:hypothetical protein